MARKVVEGAIQGARDIGIDATKAATAAANGAIKGASEVSQVAAGQVTQALTGVIDGVKIVVTEPCRPATARS